jgi:hypothetical protein
MFRRNILALSSRLKSKPGKKQASELRLPSVFVGILLGSHLDSEDGSDI